MEHVGRMEHSGNINLGISWIQLTIMGRFTSNNVTDSTNQHAIIVSSILTRKAGDIHQSQQEQATQYLVNPSVYGYIYIYVMVMYWIILAFSDRLQIPGSPEPPSASETHCFDESQPAPPNRNLPSAGWANAQAAKRFGAGRIPVQWLVLDKHETTHMKKHSWITTLKRHVNMFDSYVWLNLKFVWFLPRVRFAKKQRFFSLRHMSCWPSMAWCFQLHGRSPSWLPLSWSNAFRRPRWNFGVGSVPTRSLGRVNRKPLPKD